MASFAKFGNDLYTGARSVDFVGRRRIWYPIAIVLVLLSIAMPFIRGGGDFGKGGRGFVVGRHITGRHLGATRMPHHRFFPGARPV